MNFKFLLTYQNQIGVEEATHIEEPIGFDGLALTHKRDLKNYGLSFEFSSDLVFYNQARQIIIDQYHRYNIDASPKLTIYLTDDLGNTSVFYKGVLLLKDLVITASTAKCKIEKDDFSRLFRNKKDIDVQLQPNKNIKLHSRTLRKETQLAVNDFNVYDFNVQVLSGNIFRTAHHLLFLGKQQELREINDNIASNLNEGSYFDITPQPIFTAQEDGVVQIKARIKGSMRAFSNNNLFGCRIVGVTHNPNYVTQDALVLYNSGFAATQQVSQSINFSFDFTIDTNIYLRKGENFWCFFRVQAQNNNPGAGVANINFRFTYNSLSFMSITQDTTSEPSSCDGIMAVDAFNQIIENITGEANSFRSNFFYNTCGRFLFLTNGFRIRKQDKPIFLSFDKLYENLKNIYNLGIAIEQEGEKSVVRVEPMTYFFLPNPMAFTINYPSDYNLSVLNDLYFNKITVGYKKFEPEEINGLNEFNSTRQYYIPIKLGNYYDSEKNRIELDLSIDFIASAYLIEFTRRLSGLGTTDTQYDNDIFLICLNQTDFFSTAYTSDGQSVYYTAGQVSERNESIEVVDIISPETVYNIRISPVRNLQRWLPYLHAQLVKNYENLKNITFRSGKGNFVVRSKSLGNSSCSPLENEYLAENQTLATVTNLAIFDAEVIEFEYPLFFNEYQAIKDNQNAKILVDNTAYYLLEVKFKPNKNKAFFKLLKAR